MLSPVGRGRTTRGIPAPGDNRGNFVGVGGRAPPTTRRRGPGLRGGGPPALRRPPPAPRPLGSTCRAAPGSAPPRVAPPRSPLHVDDAGAGRGRPPGHHRPTGGSFRDRCAAGAEPRIHLLRRPPRSPQLSPPRLCGPRWSPCRSGLPADPADPRLLTPHPEQSPARTWAVVSDAVGCVEGALRPVAQVGQHQAPVTQVGQHQAPLTQITMSVYTVAALPGPWGCSRDSTTACSALAPWPSPSLPTATLPAHGAQTVPLLGVHI
eukprot:XP_022280032.1 basic proline-rich protein-like [Canis lupus familiaris]